MFPVSAQFALIFAVAWNPQVHGESFLSMNSSKRAVNMKARTEELQNAMSAVLGCGGSSKTINSSVVTRKILPIWHSLPKNEYNQVEWRQLRYVAHRYFMQKSSFMIRGLEPVRQLNASHVGAAEILSKEFPGLVEMMFDGHRAKHGFSLDDATIMLVTLEQLIFNSETTLLEAVYETLNYTEEQILEASQLRTILTNYMVHWMLNGDAESIQVLTENERMREEVLPSWRQISEMVEGTIESMKYRRARKYETGSTRNVMANQFTFDDAHEIVGEIGSTFAHFWETECQAIKKSLVALDKANTGRVRLSDFYGANLDGEWRFGESESYLRELGALDESSAWRGKQVIIPNYLQGTSNCIVTAPNYLVCCINECEEILGEIETAVGAPIAQPDNILELVGNMSNYHDEPPKLDKSLRGQLQRIADTHGGSIPVHGRLFSQWLHFVFPRECPFPHKAGDVVTLAPAEYGDKSLATNEEMVQHSQINSAGQDDNMENTDDSQWMSQWSEEEELVGDYSSELRVPWESRHVLAFAGALIFAIALLWAGMKGNHQGVGFSKFSNDAKCHFV